MQEGKALEEVISFFQNKLTLLDFLIIGLGTFLAFYQLSKRFFTTQKRFLQKAGTDSLYLVRLEFQITYITNLIELLPIMGILGTVWGLMSALSLISFIDMPTVKDIATHIAPALTTTFFGLLFAVINLFFANFLQNYFSEMIACYRQAEKAAQSQTTQITQITKEDSSQAKSEQAPVK